ncbi:MAG: helix-turn-helix domain-containing protein [Clostridia bacterium]|nr:helix-turn-helix domain-containing protein [Clostridia bacterium]
MTFSEQVVQVREQLRISQEKLAQELNISHATVSIWESGKHSPQTRYRMLFENFCRNHGISFSGTEKTGSIKTLYVKADEMPSSCVACPLTDEYSDSPNVRCQVTDEIISASEDTLTSRPASCPLRILKK